MGGQEERVSRGGAGAALDSLDVEEMLVGMDRDRIDPREGLPYSKLPQVRALLRSAVEQGTFHAGVLNRAVREWLGKRQVEA